MEQQYESIFPERNTNYAGFFDRFIAAFIDSILLMVVNLSSIYLFTHNFFKGNTFTFILNIVINCLYYALLESGNKQATLGKQLMGIKIIDINGGRISFGQGLGRFFGKYLSTIILLIGYLMVLWDDKKQALHDKLASTLVVQKSE